jgi:hypothetical protein
MDPEKILDLERQIADLKVELAGYQKSSGTSGSKEKIQVFKLVNEFLHATQTARPTAYEASADLSGKVTELNNTMSNPGGLPTVLQITSALSSCFLPLFQHLDATHQDLFASQQVLEATRDELAIVKAMNEGLQQQATQYSSDNSAQSKIEALKNEISAEQARFTAARQENKKLKAQNVELKEKVGSLREQLRVSKGSYSTPGNEGSLEPSDVLMVDGSTTRLCEVLRGRDAEIHVLEREQELLTRAFEGEKNKRLGVEMELADLKAEHEMQEKLMLDWFLELVRVTNGEEYLKQVKTLKQIRPTPPASNHDSFYSLLGRK